MKEKNAKPIKSGKRGYSMKDVVGNLKEFTNSTRFGNVQLTVHNGEIVRMKMYPEIDAKRGF